MRSTILRLPIGARPVVLAVAALLTAVPQRAGAHDIPSRVTLLAFVKPEPGRLRMVIRAPLEAMRDVTWPEKGLGYLDLAHSAPLARDAAQLWIAGFIEAYENGDRLPDPRVLATRISLPSDRSFTSYDAAVARVLGPPLDTATELPWQQAAVDVVLEFPIRSAHSNFAVRPALARLGQQTTTVLRFITPDGAERAYQYVGDPGLVRLDPRWYHAAWQFVKLGIAHILSGIDHLLFVLCLVIPFRRIRPLVMVVTAFTVAHSITLASSALGVAPDALWFPPLIETLIAASIVYMALENIVGARLHRRWLIAFGFGLVHGFGFSFALRQSLQFAGSHLAVSLFTFNLGVEIGQLMVLAVAVPLLSFAFRRVVAERVGVIVLSALVAHTAWHWMLDRGATLSQYEFTWPAFDLSLALSATRATIVLLIVGGAAWGLSEAFRRLWRANPEAEAVAVSVTDA
ncbi:MAG TPA: HupE/UreJ family protein [Gemmatimonadaceae bacterium]|nr:HupE/UreJ family protein [Gemmatimonadaceae bacterium]